MQAQSNALCHTVQGYYAEEICSRRVSESGQKKVLLLSVLVLAQFSRAVEVDAPHGASARELSIAKGAVAASV